MVAGIKGAAFLSSEVVAVSSSTKSEVFLVSVASKTVQRSIALGASVKAESLCALSESELLVADASGTLCRVDLSTSPATTSCVATSPDDFRVTSVAAWQGASSAIFVAGAARGKKTECKVRRVDGAAVLGEAMLEAPMIRALCVDRDRLFAGAIDVADEEAEEATTTLFRWRASDDFRASEEVGTVDYFVHSMARHPHHDDVFLLLARHHANSTTFDIPVRVVRLEPGGGLSSHRARCAILATLPIGHDGLIGALTRHTVAAAFGVRAGREHAMAVSPDGTVLTGSVDKSTKGVLQLWDAQLLFNDDGSRPPGPHHASATSTHHHKSPGCCASLCAKPPLPKEDRPVEEIPPTHQDNSAGRDDEDVPPDAGGKQ